MEGCYINKGMNDDLKNIFGSNELMVFFGGGSNFEKDEPE